jgi:peptidoglycan/xylan/chitin deacetylase (PgdA/CDA1 family)
MTSRSGPAGATEGGPWIALTFDDGPSHYRTRTLRTLREKRVPATFFELGLRTAANPQFAAFQQAEGHLVLNHTWSHPDLTTLSPAQVASQVLRTEEVLRSAGAPMPFKLLRPPFGAAGEAVGAQLTSLGYHHVNWDVAAADWDVTTTAGQIRDTILAALAPGVVLLVHDGAVDSANGPAGEAALPQIIDQARRRGFRFGLLGPAGTVVPARYRGTGAPVPEIVNPVPYLPPRPYGGGLLPPPPSENVDPAAQL